MLFVKMWTAGRPWAHVKAKVKKDYPSVQYTAWTVVFYYHCRK